MCSLLRLFKMSENIEAEVCSVDDLRVNEKRLVEVGGTKVLLIRTEENEYAAVGNVCTHYGAPLINGVYHNGYISCPWHGACFHVQTGDIEEFPGCDSLPVYETRIVNDKVVVKLDKESAVKKRLKPMVGRSKDNKSTFVILGGGPAGFQCAETLRQEDFDGRIILVSSEDVPPYDRTKLSKSLTVKIEEILLRNMKHYEDYGIELMLNKRCTALNIHDKQIRLDDKSTLSYDKLFIATGSSPRVFPALSEATNVHYMRTHHDATRIANGCDDQNVVLIGSSFIVLEIAALLVQANKAESITIVSRSEVPFDKSLGKTIGAQIKKLIISKGVIFHHNKSNMQFEIQNNKLVAIKFDDTRVDVDVCILGVGSVPNTSFARKCALNLSKDTNYIEVNEYFQTSVPDIYAGGDVVVFPNTFIAGKVINISHWQTAQQHGRKAALSMLDKESDFQTVPFFWSALFGKGIRFCGFVHNPDNVVIEGDVTKLSFAAFYLDGVDRVIGVATMANDPVATAFGAALRTGRVITKSDIQNEGMKWCEDIIV